MYGGNLKQPLITLSPDKRYIKKQKSDNTEEPKNVKNK